MLTYNEKDNCWDGRLPFELDFSAWDSDFGVFRTTCIVRARQDITNDNVSEAFFEVMSHLGHLSKKTIVHPELVAQLSLMRCGAQLVFPHQSKKNSFILTGLHYFRVLPALYKLSNGIEDEMKATAEFNRDVLRGYKYKHLRESSVPSLAKNIANQIKKPGWFESQIDKYQDQLENAQTAQEQSAIYSHIAVIEGLQDRTQNQHMTGEWIVFKESIEGFELLTIGVHQETDQDIKNRIASTDKRIVLTHKHSIDECEFKPLFI